MMRALLVTGLCAALAWPASAQTGMFSGTVSRDTLGHGVPKAEVQLPALKRSVTTNAQGAFDFGSVPAGRYLMMVRAIGFQLLADSIDIKPGARFDADVLLDATAVELPTQRTTATTIAKRLPPGLQEMEERRKEHLGGFFVTDSVLRLNDERKLTYFIAGIPGIDQVYGTGSSVFLANPFVHKGAVGTDQFGVPPIYPLNHCYIDVYLDGARYFVGPARPTNPPPDFNAMLAAEYSGIEYYSSGATIPSQYNMTGSGCGVMLLWTRRTP